jgi:hypothetical protein
MSGTLILLQLGGYVGVLLWGPTWSPPASSGPLAPSCAFGSAAASLAPGDADIGNEQPLDDDDEGARGQEILSAVINLEHAGDIIANNLLEFAARRTRRGGGFAAEELETIAAMHAELIESLRLGLTVFLRGDAALREARLLVTRKRRLRILETEAAALNMRSLQLAPDGPGAFTRTSQRSPTPCSNARPRLAIAIPSEGRSPQSRLPPKRNAWQLPAIVSDSGPDPDCAASSPATGKAPLPDPPRVTDWRHLCAVFPAGSTCSTNFVGWPIPKVYSKSGV